jgi:hypothetical protein
MRVRPLSPVEAKRSILHRIAPVVDKARQVGVVTGLRSRRVFLVWTQWDGARRGEGDEVEVDRMELLPTPKVTGLDSVALNPFAAGQLPEGSIRVDLISARYVENALRGKYPPTLGLDWSTSGLPQDVSFFYEVVEDGRGDRAPYRGKYRIASQFVLREGRVSWSVVLERTSEDNDPETGASRFAPGGAYG